MKVAITSTGNKEDSTIDQRFGRCAYLVIYDTVSKSVEYIPNPGKDAEEDAGPVCVQLAASRDVTKIISGEFGIKIKALLDSMKVQMIMLKDPDIKINEIIEMLNH